MGNPGRGSGDTAVHHLLTGEHALVAVKDSSGGRNNGHDGAPLPVVDGFIAALVETSCRRHVLGATPL
jgi:hypothetical protein